MPFRDVAGHRPIRALLARAVERQSVPPTLLFSGPAGVGKRLTADALAQALNCEQPVEFDPAGRDACGECRTCRRIARGVHADILLIEPGDTGSIKIDQIREAIDRSAYRPFEGRRRVVIVDQADALVGEAQNSLLKTLEEPPPASVFVLVTALPDVLLPTVLSRSHRLRFGPLAASEVADVLVRNHGYTPQNAHAAAAAADGSVGRALELDLEDAAEVREAAARVLQVAAASADPRRRLDSAKLLAAGGGDRGEVARRLLALSSMLRDLALLFARGEDRTLANADFGAHLRGLVRSFDDRRAVRAFAAVDKGLAALDRNASPKIVADWVALNI
jgi:DNA polymerase III subunit delta'